MAIKISFHDKSMFRITTAMGMSIALVFLAAGMHLFIFFQDRQEKLIQEDRREIERLKEGLVRIEAASSEANTGLLSQLKEETQKREDAKTEQESTDKQTAQKLSQLQADALKAKKNELTSVIKKWRTRVAHIECTWIYTNNTRLAKGGSGFLLKATQLLTNKHVMTDEQGQLPSYCEISVPDDPKKLVLGFETPSDVFISPDRDFVSIRINAPTDYMKKEASVLMPFCKVGGVIGDQIVILGYPAIGAKEDVTATEGILSAYEDPYYITSAKLERGNSGGAAVLVKGDCYLGIPTFVRMGNLESLGRILDVRKVEIP